VFNHGPCIPEIDYPYGENLQLTIQTVPAKEDEENYLAARPRPRHYRRSLRPAAFVLITTAVRTVAR